MLKLFLKSISVIAVSNPYLNVPLEFDSCGKFDNLGLTSSCVCPGGGFG